MLAHWLQPDTGASQTSWTKDQIGGRVHAFFPEMEAIPPGSVVLLGYEEKSAGSIRKQLWSLAWAFGNTRIVDLGNLRKAEPDFAVQLLRELIDGQLTVLLMGGPDDLTLPLYQAYADKIKGVSACLITARPDYRTEGEGLIQRLLRPGDNHLFHLSLLAWQRHFLSPSAPFTLREEHHADLMSLGQIHYAPEEAEPAIRDADMLSLRLDALQVSFAPAALQAGPNGLDGIEVCQLARYAGISDKLTSFCVSGWRPYRDRQHRTAQLVAQILWYFLEGFTQRFGDFPVSMEGLIEYRVDHEHLTEPLVFWKSSRTGRWWLQVPVREDAGHERHRLVPCTYGDYQEACRNELPDRIMQAQLRYRS
ncbi:MAG: arginase family protein [Saprospiraceae bacterium]|nr:arginase family protein [Saprospiraceae bacterium]